MTGVSQRPFPSDEPFTLPYFWILKSRDFRQSPKIDRFVRQLQFSDTGISGGIMQVSMKCPTPPLPGQGGDLSVICQKAPPQGSRVAGGAVGVDVEDLDRAPPPTGVQIPPKPRRNPIPPESRAPSTGVGLTVSSTHSGEKGRGWGALLGRRVRCVLCWCFVVGALGGGLWGGGGG